MYKKPGYLFSVSLLIFIFPLYLQNSIFPAIDVKIPL